MGNIVCKKTVPQTSGMCGKCPVCLGHPGFGHCAYWKKETEIIKCGVCENCARCGFPGYGPQCKFWDTKDLLKKDGDIKGADAYADAVGMDDANRRILHIAKTEGPPAMFKAMFTGEQGQELSYAEMRSRYG